MDPAIKGGFAIGFAALAVAAAIFGWSQGWIEPRADKPAETSRLATPSGQGATPGPSAPAEKPSSGDKPGAGAGPAPQAATPPAGDQSAGRAPSPDAPAGATPPATPDAPRDQPAAPSAPGDVAALTPPSAAPNPSDAAPVGKGVFDIVRVEPNGDLVAAGRCPGGCSVELTANGRTIETAKADSTGAFVLTPPSLPAGDHQLGLKITGPDGAQSVSEQTVTVSVPAAPSKDVVVVLNDPDAPSKILQQPGQAPSAAKPAPGATADRTPGSEAPAQTVASLSLGAVDAENGRFFVQGTAPAGAKLRVYLNNAPVAEPVAGPDGRWSLKVEQGLTPGKYVARVDQIGADGKVANRAEQGFAYETEMAAAGQGGAAGQPAAAPAPSGSSAKPDAASPARPDAASAVRPGGTPAETPSGAAAGQRAGSGGVAAVSPAPGSASPAAPDAGQAASGASSPDGGAGASSQASGAQTPAAGVAAQANGEPDKSAASVAAGQAPAAASGGTGPDAANPVVKSIDTAQVKRGDSLWRISRATYGRGQRYTAIFTANDGQIRNPDLIYPGQVLVLPPAQAGAAADARSGR